MPVSIAAFVRDSGYLRKWLLLGVAIGVVAGPGAVFDYRSLVPGFNTSGTAYAVHGSFLGFEPMFGTIVSGDELHPAQLIWFAVIGIISAAVGYLHARSFYDTVALTGRLPGCIVIKPPSADQR